MSCQIFISFSSDKKKRGVHWEKSAGTSLMHLHIIYIWILFNDKLLWLLTCFHKSCINLSKDFSFNIHKAVSSPGKKIFQKKFNNVRYKYFWWFEQNGIVKCWNRFLSLIKLNNEIWISAKYYKLLKLVRVKAHISVWSRFIIFSNSFHKKVLNSFQLSFSRSWMGGWHTGIHRDILEI